MLGSGQAVFTYALSGDEDRVYAATANGVAVSSDGGATWGSAVDVFQGDSVNALAVDPTDSSIVLASLAAGAFRSTDGGQTWAPANDGILTPSFVESVATDPSDPSLVYAGTKGGIWRSHDAGVSWSYSEVGLPPNTTFIRDVTVDPLDTATVFIQALYGGYFVSHDHGLTWATLYPHGNGLSSPVEVDPSNDQHLVIPWGYGFAQSFDGGQSFVYQIICCNTSQDSGQQMFERAAIDPRDPATIYLGAKDGVWLSTDAGATWTRVLYLGDPTGTSPHARVMEVDRADPNTIYFAPAYRDLYVSHDRGESWQVAFDGQVRSLTLDPSTTPSTAYLGNEGLYQTLRSTDGGTTWTPDEPGATSSDAMALGETVQPPDLSHPTRELYTGNATVERAAFVAATPTTTLVQLAGGAVPRISVTHRLIRLTVRCVDGWSQRCRGHVLIRARGTSLADHVFDLAPGTRTRLSIRLAGAIRRMLHRQPHGVRGTARVLTTGRDRTVANDRHSIRLIRR